MAEGKPIKKWTKLEKQCKVQCLSDVASANSFGSDFSLAFDWSSGD